MNTPKERSCAALFLRPQNGISESGTTASGYSVRIPRTAARVPSALAELHTVDDDLRHIALVSVLRVVAARLDASLHGNLLPLRDILADDLRWLFPRNALYEICLLLAVSVPASVNRKREIRARFPALRVSPLPPPGSRRYFRLLQDTLQCPDSDRETPCTKLLYRQ